MATTRQFRPWMGASRAASRDAAIDERSQANAQWAAACQLAGAGSFSIHLTDGRFVVDERCREIFGASLVAGSVKARLTALLDRVHPDDAVGMRQAMERVTASGGPFEIHGRVTSWQGDGAPGERWLSAAGTVFIARNGSRVIAGAVVDRTEAQLRDERALRGQKREALGALAAGIAHDLNNVMGAIVGNAELARRQLEMGVPAIESVLEVERAADRAGEMLRRLLLFGREDAPRRAPFDLAEVACDACGLLAPTIDRSIRVRPPTLAGPCEMVGDAAQVHQLIVNLVSNAAYVCPKGGEISVCVDRADDAGAPAWRLRVIDDGPGIEEHIRTQIFDPFFTTKDPDEGTGLGLAAASTIVELHGGSISVASDPGHGATFTVVLPEHHADPDAPHAVGSGESANHGAIRVALVSASEERRRRAKRAMPSFGCVPVVFADADEALAQLASEPTAFDALVVDGDASARPAELIRRARAICPDLPVIVHAGNDAAVTQLEARALGADAWVPHPCPPSELCSVIHRVA